MFPDRRTASPVVPSSTKTLAIISAAIAAFVATLVC